MRDKFMPRTVYLKTGVQQQHLISLIANLPLDEENPLQVDVHDMVVGRGLDANRYYQKRIGEIAEQAWIDGKQFAHEVWHDYAKRVWMPEEITTKDGTVRSKWTEAPDGKLTVISTTLLERKCFAEYTTKVESEGAALGVQFSANPRERMAA